MLGQEISQCSRSTQKGLRFDKPCLHGACAVHRGIVMMEQA